jgi:hypothetical protein
LALAAKLQRKALAVGMVLPGVAEETIRVAEGVSSLAAGDPDRGGAATVAGPAPSDAGGPVDGEGGRADQASLIGELLFSLVNVARALGIDPESALRARATGFRSSVEESG